MTESESVALPLGDAPIYAFLRTHVIITEWLLLVKGLLKKIPKSLWLF